MFTDIINCIFRAIVGFIVLVASARLMGRKTLSEMTFFNFAVAVTIGTLTADFGIAASGKPLNSLAVMLTITGLGLLSAFLSLHSFRFRKAVNAEPVVLIENGHIVKENMQKTRLTLDALTAMLRQKNAFNIADVEFAILEIDGKISVQPKSQKQPVTPSDLHIPTQYKGLTKEIIIDGNIMDENLKDVHLDRNWLEERLRDQGIERAEDVFFAALDSSGQLYVSKGIDKKEKEGQYGIE